MDQLIGLKENVLIGKLIPAGTGMKRYRNIRLNTDGMPTLQEKLAAQRAQEEAERAAEEAALADASADIAEDAEMADDADVSDVEQTEEQVAAETEE